MNRVKRCFYVNFSFRLFSKKNRPDGVGRKKEKEETTDWSSAKRSAIRQPRNRPINRWLSDPINIRTHHSIERRSSRQKWRGPIKIFDTGIDILRRPEKNSAPKNSRCCCCFFWFTWKFQKKKKQLKNDVEFDRNRSPIAIQGSQSKAIKQTTMAAVITSRHFVCVLRRSHTHTPRDK